MIGEFIQMIGAVTLSNMKQGDKARDQRAANHRINMVPPLLSQGKSVALIAKMTGLSEYKVRKIRGEVEINAQLGPEPKFFSVENRVRMLYDTDLAQHKIAKKVGLSESEVDRMITKYILRS